LRFYFLLSKRQFSVFRLCTKAFESHDDYFISCFITVGIGNEAGAGEKEIGDGFLRVTTGYFIVTVSPPRRTTNDIDIDPEG
jgi:hypothetical protein